MTPEELSVQLQRVTGHPCPVWPARTPTTWVADPVDGRFPLPELASELGLDTDGERLLLRLDDAEVDRGLAAVAAGVTHPPAPEEVDPGSAVCWAVRQQGAPASRRDLSRAVGAPTAAWALWRAGPAGIDVPPAALRTLGEQNPLVAVLRARDRVQRMPVMFDDRLAGLVLQWPMVARAAAASGRTRPAALHVEQVAAAVLASVPGGRTTPRLGEATRIVLQAGLDAAGVHAPDRI